MTTRAERGMNGSFSARAILHLRALRNRGTGLARHRISNPARFDDLKCNPAICGNANEVRRFGPPGNGENRRLYVTSLPLPEIKPDPMLLNVLGHSGRPSSASVDSDAADALDPVPLNNTGPSDRV